MLGVFLLAAATAPLVGELKTFKDWVVGCDNGLSCMAVGQFSNDNFDLASVVLERGPKPGDVPDFWFNVPDGPFTDLAADGKRLGLRFRRSNDRYDIEHVHVVATSMPALLGALKSATSLTAIGADGKVIEQLSISGASAAMRWMDERQKRAGTVTALVATGPKLASTVPAPPALPVVTQVIGGGRSRHKLSDAEVVKIQDRYAECTDDDVSNKVEYAQLDPRTTLAIVTAVCASGAYNFYGIPLLIRDNGRPGEARFEKRDSEDLTMNLSWDDKASKLSSYFKGRGIGDCGGGTDWVWDGRMFRIVEERVMDECLGAITWIPVFRARPVPSRVR